MDAASESKLSTVNPALAQIVRQMDTQVRAQGGRLSVISGRRSYAQQAALYANRASNSNPVAAPGTSLHEKGLAVDLSWSGVTQSYVGQLGESYGLRWGGRFSRPDPGHFELTNGAAAYTPAPAPLVNAPVVPAGGGGEPSRAGEYLALSLVVLLVVRLIRS